MKKLDYEVKYGKYISFKHKDKARFTRAKIIGDDYTEEKLKERINENANHRNYTVKKRIGNIIDINGNEKIKANKRYEYWASKHTLQVATDIVVLMREKGITTLTQLDNFIKASADKKQDLQDKIKVIDSNITRLSETMEQVHIVKLYREIYLEHKKDTTDKAFFEEHKSEILLYQNALSELKNAYSKLPDTKDILNNLDLLEEKRIP